MSPSSAQLEAVLRSLLGCLCVALGEAGWEGDCCLEPGEAAWDQCCPGGCADGGGKAWVRMIELYPTDRYPLQGAPADPSKCEVEWAVRAELGATSCVCFEVADCEVREANARRVIQVVSAALGAAACCDVDDVRIEGVTVLGPQADCAGASMTVTVPTSVCCGT